MSLSMWATLSFSFSSLSLAGEGRAGPLISSLHTCAAPSPLFTAGGTFSDASSICVAKFDL